MQRTSKELSVRWHPPIQVQVEKASNSDEPLNACLRKYAVASATAKRSQTLELESFCNGLSHLDLHECEAVGLTAQHVETRADLGKCVS
jgi:hypothetical protein